jgi:hypothetical protein
VPRRSGRNDGAVESWKLAGAPAQLEIRNQKLEIALPRQPIRNQKSEIAQPASANQKLEIRN